MNKKLRIAIDGPSGAGKSTIAKLIAKKLELDYIDTGAMYRAIGYKVKINGVDPEDEAALSALLKDTEIDFSGGVICLDGIDVSEEIRTPEMSQIASVCSAKRAVREKLIILQRAMGQNKSVIMDGRDIGTNVLTDAEYKFYLTASVEERAQRRWAELQAKGDSITLEQVEADIRQRDHNDMTRELNPLKKADDAAELDSTGMTIEQVVDAIIIRVLSHEQ